MQKCHYQPKYDISALAETCVGHSVYAENMNTKYPLASTAALIADPARAAMLTVLLDGSSMPAGELARVAGVSAQSASMHLGQLVEGGFLVASRRGRHRYYRMSKPEVAHAVESLGAISTVERYKPSGADQAICYARTCYDHLAGEFAIQLRAAFERNGLLISRGDRDYDLTGRGEEFFGQWKIDANRSDSHAGASLAVASTGRRGRTISLVRSEQLSATGFWSCTGSPAISTAAQCTCRWLGDNS